MERHDTEPVSETVVISLCTRGHQWRFACVRGDEQTLVDTLIELVEQDEAPLEWSDAAAVIRQLNDQPMPDANSTEPLL